MDEKVTRNEQKVTSNKQKIQVRICVKKIK